MKLTTTSIAIKAAILLTLLLSTKKSTAQFYSLKTNLLEIAALGTVNLDLSMMVAPRWTINLDMAYNPWSHKKEYLKNKHYKFEPGARYWFWQTYTGGFVSMYGIATEFNVIIKDRYQGYGLGVGATYGYAWAIAKRWNIEAEIGIGALWNRHSVSDCANCGREIIPTKTYLSPSLKAGLSIVYLF